MLPRVHGGRGKWNNMGRAERIGGVFGARVAACSVADRICARPQNRRETWEPRIPGPEGPPAELQLDAVDELGGPGANRAKRPESASAPRNSHLLP